ncbi:hypothetical protein [Mycobacterium camsae]|uniref:hypothetical protein n=1 Tax=Mycobacterium gordonae TaxID=1778 RepID=UPI00197CDC34|nr:hypothetical protein [Mycobacterium gordonae]
MSIETPPPPDELSGPRQQLRQWAQNVPEDFLKIDPSFLNEWLGGINSLVLAIDAQVAAAGNLRINEGVVGKFVSATATASALNSSGDAIRQRLAEYQQFANALKEFSLAAHHALVATDGQ